MNSFKSLICVILLSTSGTDANWTAAQWNGIVDNREIFINGKVTTMRHDFNLSSNIPDMDTFINVRPNVMYTALKCKYSDAIIDVLQTLYELIVIGYRELKNANFDFQKQFRMTWLNMALESFAIIKPFVAKMIYNLFFYWNKHPALRTSDQSLLKTMLSINLFLYYNDKHKPYAENVDDVCSLNTAILQMIGLLESFRLKNCHGKDPNANYTNIINQLIIIMDISVSTDNILSIFGPKVKYLRDLLNNGPVLYDDYDEFMYDPDYLVLGNILQFNNRTMAKYKTLYKNKSTTLKVRYENIIATYDIDDIFGYQSSLIDIIIDIFFRQILDLLVNDDPDPKHELQTTLNYFIEFNKKIMLSNCLTSACLSTKNFINLSLYKNRDGEIKFVQYDVIEQIKHSIDPFNEPFWIYYNRPLLNKKNLSVGLLVENILKDEQFKSFSQTVKLLSYESNTNCNHYILKLHDITGNINMVHAEEDRMVLRFINDLRNTLYLFRIKLKSLIVSTSDPIISRTENADPTYSESPFKYTFRSLKKRFNSFKNHPVIQNAMLPLLVHLHYERRCNYYNVKLGHLLHLTINTMENYIFRVCKSPPSNLVTYSEAITVPRFRSDLDQETSLQLLSNDDTESGHSDTGPDLDEQFHNLFSVYDYKWFLADKYEDLVFYWGGCNTHASNILSAELVGNVTVINYQDLVQYQWFTIKWFLSKILLTIKYVLTELENLKNSGVLGTSFQDDLIKDIDELAKLQLPLTVMESITTMIKLFKIVLSDSKSTDLKVTTMLVVDEYFSTLGLANTIVSYENVNYYNLKTDIEHFQKHLNKIKNERTVFAKDMDFSMVLFPA